jgi:hypothetical protein
MDSSRPSHLRTRILSLKNYGVNMDLADERELNEQDGVIEGNGSLFYVLILGEEPISCHQCDQMRVDTPQVRIYRKGEVIGAWYKKYIKKIMVTGKGVELTLNIK